MKEQVFQTISVLPGAQLSSDGSTYPQRLADSRQLSHKDFQELFENRLVVQIPGSKFDILITRRPEFDADPLFDHMLVVAPKSGVSNVWDFMSLVEHSPEDAVLLLTTLQKVIESYRKESATISFGVLNTSSVDFGGVIIEENQNNTQAFRQPQSMMFVHAKAMGYPEDTLEQREIKVGEEVYVHRPLQNEMNQIVGHLANYRLGLEVVNTQFDPNGVVIDQNSTQFLEFYKRFHETMELINFMAIGGDHSLMAGIQSGKVDVPMLQEWANQKFNLDRLNKGRVSSKTAVENIKDWLKLLSNNTVIKGKPLGRLFEEYLLKDTTLQSTIVMPFIKKYLEAYSNYLEKHPETQIPWGPFYSTLFHFHENKFVVSFVPAEIIRKGANTVTGIFPQESKIPPTADQVATIIKGDELLKQNLSI